MVATNLFCNKEIRKVLPCKSMQQKNRCATAIIKIVPHRSKVHRGYPDRATRLNRDDSDLGPTGEDGDRSPEGCASKYAESKRPLADIMKLMQCTRNS